MNLKYYFYRKYYEGIDLRKFKDKYSKEKIEKVNVDKFNTYNDNIQKYKLDKTSNYFPLNELLKEKDQYKEITLATQYPGLFIGSGYPHLTNNKEEITLGFYFDHTTGLPVIPGSSVKGTLRSMFPQFKPSAKNFLIPDLIAKEKKDKKEKEEEIELKKNKSEYIAFLLEDVIGEISGMELYAFVHQLELQIFTGLNIEATQKAIQEKKPPVYFPIGKRDCFLDTVPITGGKNGKLMGVDSITPHTDGPLKNPTPLPFIKVLPNVSYSFQFLLFTSSLENKSLSDNDKKEFFEKILLDIGIGAKTNVGYGQFSKPIEAATYEVNQVIEGTIVKIFPVNSDIEVTVQGHDGNLYVRGVPKKKFDALSIDHRVCLKIRVVSEDKTKIERAIFLAKKT